MKTPLRILHVEDSESDAQLVARHLRKAEFEISIERVETADQMRIALARQSWDAVLSDYNLPQFDGEAALEVLHATGQDIPFIVVSGAIGEETAVKLMRRGAHDYVMKSGLVRLAPALARELQDARVRQDRRRAEAALGESERRLRMALEAGAMGVFDRDISSGRSEWSDQQFRLFGLQPGADPRDHDAFVRLVHPEDRPGVEAAMERTTRLGEPDRQEFRVVWADGSVHWLSSQGQCYLDERGRPVRIVGVSKDITARKQAEQDLRDSEERFRQLFDSGGDAIFVSHLSPEGTSGRFVEVNAVACQRLGYTRDELLQRTAYDITPPDRLAAAKVAGQTLLQQRFVLVESEHLTRGGRRIPVEIHARLFELHGELTVLSVARDISQRKSLEEQLREAQKMEAIGQLAGGVAHDFNNILTSMLINLGLLLDDSQLAPGMREAFKELEDEAKRAMRLTRQLLLFSRRHVSQLAAIDLNEVLRHLLLMLRRLLGENITLEFQNHAEPRWIEADAGMMEQVIVNLCVNARDAMMPKGGRLTLRTELVELNAQTPPRNAEARPGRFVRLTVADTGCGMDADILKRIFEPFFTTKEVGKGTGLGLATIYGITKQHHGWIEVASVVGQGSSFCVYLPAQAQPPPAAQEAVPAERPRGGSETIVLVEDQEFVRKMTALSLRRHGYRVLEAINGQEAIRLWDKHAREIDLVMTDMIMPEGISGMDLAERFTANKPGIKIIVSSGYSAEILKTGATRPPGVSFLPKPYEVHSLAATVRNRLDRS